GGRARRAGRDPARRRAGPGADRRDPAQAAPQPCPGRPWLRGACTPCHHRPEGLIVTTPQPRPALSRHRAVRHVEQVLRDLGAPGEVVLLSDSARTAAEAAEALGVEVGAIASSLVFLLDDEPLLVLTSGA